MTTSAYMSGRKVAGRGRPQGVLLANNPGTLTQDGFYIPNGYEVGADVPNDTAIEDIDQFIILSDDNRGPLDFNIQRLERRERTINGRMRSYHIADKLQISVSWDMLPSRSFATKPNFGTDGKPTATVPGDSNGDKTVSVGETIPVTISANRFNKDQQYTTDGGAGGAEILDWYETHPGSFWVYLSYDKYPNFSKEDAGYQNLNKYSQIIEVFFSDFKYSVEKRGGSTYDFWNISFSLEEV
jgi:hypothetical protein